MKWVYDHSSHPIQLPTLYFSVLMLAHILDHFVFTARRLSDRTKQIIFGVCVALIVGVFWWFKGVSFGIDGPINDHWGLQWRSVRCILLTHYVSLLTRRSSLQNWNLYNH